MKTNNILLLILILVVSTSCADTVHVEILTEDSPYGFWLGVGGIGGLIGRSSD